MPKLRRVVVPEIPYHITQRGNRRQQTFFCDDDYRGYLKLMASTCKKFHVEILAYCLMPNHVHLLVTPTTEQSLALAMGKAHKSYSETINRRQNWRGCLWRGRFFSSPLDDNHIVHAARYVLNNPVRAHLVDHAEDWPWSSAKVQMAGGEDILVRKNHLEGITDDWRAFLANDSHESYEEIRRGTTTGRPIGDENFYKKLEILSGRSLTPILSEKKKSEKIIV